MTKEPKTKTQFYVHSASITGNLILGRVNRARIVKIDKSWDSLIYDAAPLLISTDGMIQFRQVDPRRGELLKLGPFQELYARSTLQSAINVHLTVEDSLNEGIGTDTGSGVEVSKSAGRSYPQVTTSIPAPGSERAFRAI